MGGHQGDDGTEGQLADLPDSTVAEPCLSFPKTKTFSPATLKALMEQEDRRAARPIGEIA